MQQARRFFILLVLLVVLKCVAAWPQRQHRSMQAAWAASWGASQQIPEPQNALSPEDMTDATLRQVFHLSVGGPAIRVHLSNAFGIEPLCITSAHIARPSAPTSSAIEPSSDRPLTFAGRAEAIIPPGAELISDPVDYEVLPLSDLDVTIHLQSPPARETGHPGSRATSYYAHGNMVGAAALTEPKHVDHWYQVSEIDVQSVPGSASVVALGDSTTDGHGATTNGNDRWTDVLAARLQSSRSTNNIGVSNQGIGGNHLLSDGLGPNALARFDRDVLAATGVRWVIIFEGVNDLGGLARDGEVGVMQHQALVERVLEAYRQITERAHAHGLRVFGATITPYTGSKFYHPGSLSEADRQAVNGWIRSPRNFDAVIDFDGVVRDPEQPDHLLPAYDCGDHLHPSPAGYKAMGDAIPLSLFSQAN